MYQLVGLAALMCMSLAAGVLGLIAARKERQARLATKQRQTSQDALCLPNSGNPVLEPGVHLDASSKEGQ